MISGEVEIDQFSKIRLTIQVKFGDDPKHEKSSKATHKATKTKNIYQIIYKSSKTLYSIFFLPGNTKFNYNSPNLLQLISHYATGRNMSKLNIS